MIHPAERQTISIFTNCMVLVFAVLSILFLPSPLYACCDMSAATPKDRFEPWDKQVFFAIAEHQGLAAAVRLRKAHDMIVANQDKPVASKLKLVNDYLNSFSWIADKVLWGQEDYWATPFETIAYNGGDCEDLAIAKYGILRMMGIADNNLGFAYVRNRDNMRHMVLLYMDATGADYLVLDSQHPDVLPAAERKDILGIYLFKNDGSFYLFDGGTNFNKFRARYVNRKLSKWTGAMEREKRNSDLLAQYNSGKPLLPID